MQEYPKIETLYQRDEAHKLTSVLKKPVFADLARWIVTEKVDGTNMRVGKMYGANTVQIGGRTANAQIPADLIQWITQNIPPTKMDGLFEENSSPGTCITLFGEGYGAGIQKGGRYREDKAFILFDVLIECDNSEGQRMAYWQDEATVTEFAQKLGIRRVPILGYWNLEEIVRNVKAGLRSLCAADADALAEGVVGKTLEPLFDRRGKRLILKLKTKDFS